MPVFLAPHLARTPLALGAAIIIVLLGLRVLAQERDRSQIPDQYKWDLAALYPSDDMWRQAKERVAEQAPSVRQYQGKLALMRQ